MMINVPNAVWMTAKRTSRDGEEKEVEEDEGGQCRRLFGQLVFGSSAAGRVVCDALAGVSS